MHRTACTDFRLYFGLLMLIGVDPGFAGLNPHSKLVMRVLYGLDPHNNVTTE